MNIPAQALITLMERLTKFPYAQICRHSVVCDLLSIMEQHGAPITEELANAAVFANDSEALVLLRDLRERLNVK